MHRFETCICESVPQFNDNLMTQFNGTPTKESEQLKLLSWKIQEATSNVAITETKEKQYTRQIIYTNQGHSPTKVTPDIDFTDKSLVQFDVPVMKNTFVDDCK